MLEFEISEFGIGLANTDIALSPKALLAFGLRGLGGSSHTCFKL